MDLSFRSLSLNRTSTPFRSRSIGRFGSIDSGISNDGEFTHIYLDGNEATMRVKVKVPSEVDEAASGGMLSQCDLDEVFEKIQQVRMFVLTARSPFIKCVLNVRPYFCMVCAPVRSLAAALP